MENNLEISHQYNVQLYILNFVMLLVINNLLKRETPNEL